MEQPKEEIVVRIPISLKLVSIFILIPGLFAIYTVIGEILELGTVSTPLRLTDIVIRALISVISPFVAYGVWYLRRWSVVLFYILILLHIVLRSLALISPHFTFQHKIATIGAMSLFVLVAIYFYTKRRLFK